MEGLTLLFKHVNFAFRYDHDYGHIKSATALERIDELARASRGKGLDPDEEYHGLAD